MKWTNVRGRGFFPHRVGTIDCRPSLAAGKLEYRHVPKFFSSLVTVPSNLLIWVFSVGIIGGYFTATGDRLQQVHLAVYDLGVRFRRGIVYFMTHLLSDPGTLEDHIYLHDSRHASVVCMVDSKVRHCTNA